MKFILDTDIGSDCDDAGALALLHQLSRKGKADILAITHCGSERTGAVTIKAINDWYGAENIPIGQYREKAFLDDERCRYFTKVVAEKYLKMHEEPEIEDSVRVLRKALAGNEGVTLAAVGPLNNIALLLKSAADDISPYSGMELVKRSVRELYVMGGNFEDFNFAEYNIRCDIDSARYVAEFCPVPVIYCGFEIGVRIKTGTLLRTADSESPVKIAYNNFEGGLRESWDPITVYCAIMGDDMFRRVSDVRVRFDEEGRAQCNPHGKDAYLVFEKSIEEIRDNIDRFIV